MEQQAPSQVIGNGVIPITPKMDALTAAFEEASRKADELQQKFSTIFDGAIQRASELKGILQEIAQVSVDLRINTDRPEPSREPSQEAQGPQSSASALPDDLKQMADSILTNSQQARFQEELLEEVRIISTNVNEILNRDQPT